MTEAYGNNTSTPRRLGVLLAAGCALWAGIALLVASMCGLGRAHASGATYLACEAHPSLPVSVHIDSSVDVAAWRAALAEWNSAYPGTFTETNGPAGATIEATSGPMWVRMGGCLGGETIVYARPEARYWYTHELGHVLGFRDWIRSTDNPAGYINPGYCDSAGTNHEEAVREDIDIGMVRRRVGGPDEARVVGQRWRWGSLEQEWPTAALTALLNRPVGELTAQPNPEALTATEVTHADQAYDGVMSYCTPRERWFGADDDKAMEALR